MSYVVTSLVSRERTRRRGFNRVFDRVAMATYRDAALSQGDVTLWLRDNATGLLTNEVQNGASLARSYDALGRPAGYTLRASATPREVSFSYDLLGRLATVSSGTNLFAYSYLLGSDLVSGYTCGGFSRTVAYEPYRDLVSAITNRFGSRVISTFEYTNDAAGRRTAIKRGGDAMGPLSGVTDAYGYNVRNEVVSARRTLGGESVAGFNEDFAYDPIGNRVSSTDYDEAGAARTSTYTANNINQYTARTVPGWASVRGLANADATVTVNGNLAYALATDDIAYFFGSDDFDNSVAGGFAELEVSAVVSDGTNDFVSIATNRVFVPPANETYAYDADGNQTLVTTGTGAWQVEYNGENRPVRWTCGDKTLLMDYDHMGRRRLYVEVAAGETNKLHRFTYDDYLCIARNREVDAQHGIGTDDFVWDPTEPIATRPLMCNPSIAPPFLYCHDGNKNVSEAVTPNGTIAAHYAYSSFGKVVLVTSESEDQSTANRNPYRFSSEYADDALGLVYYNWRHYNPNVGRWTSRDPMEDDESNRFEYLFCDNNCNLYYDYIGGSIMGGLRGAGRILRRISLRGLGRVVGKNFEAIESGIEKVTNLYEDTKGAALLQGYQACMKGRSEGKCDACCVVVIKMIGTPPKYAVLSATVQCSKCSEASKGSHLIPGYSLLGFLDIKVEKCD